MIGLAFVVEICVFAGSGLVAESYGIFVISLFKNGNELRIASYGEVVITGNAYISVDCVCFIACFARAEVAVLVNDIGVLLLAVNGDIVSVFNDIVSEFIGLIFNLVPALEVVGEVVVGSF